MLYFIIHSYSMYTACLYGWFVALFTCLSIHIKKKDPLNDRRPYKQNQCFYIHTSLTDTALHMFSVFVRVCLSNILTVS